MKLSQIGEFGLIERLARRERKQASTIIGIGDDAAVLRTSKNALLATTDTLVENVDFRKKGLSFFYLGRKALIANISDISAMGGWPTHALVTLGLPKNTDVAAVDKIYLGIDSMAKKLKIDIIGGDTTDSALIFITITLLGEVEKKNLVLRSTARPGDFICVTGSFGGSAAVKYDSRKQKVESRTQEARIIAKAKLATAMIDSSDGLMRSVLEICRASKVGARLYEDCIPVADGATLDQALFGGEEYELVFTVSPDKLFRLKKSGLRVSLVGEVGKRGSGVRLVDGRGKIKQVKFKGYEHFK